MASRGQGEGSASAGATPRRPPVSLHRAISLGEPDPAEGIVEIPIVEKEVRSHQSHFKVSPSGRPSGLPPRLPSCQLTFSLPPR